MDISNAIAKNSDITIKGTDDFTEIRNSDLVVISASTGTYEISRTQMIKEQVSMIQEIANKITTYCPDSTTLVISNPLDVLTYVFQKESGFLRNKIIGVASSLDSSRFRYMLCSKLGVKQSQIHNAQVLGEHGDTMVPIFSQVKINQSSLDDLIDNQEKIIITEEIRNYWKTLRSYKSRSQFGIAKNTFDVMKSILNNSPIEIPASVVLNGEYDERNVAMGVPVKIDKNGIIKIHEIELDENERLLLKKSAEAIRKNIKSSFIEP